MRNVKHIFTLCILLCPISIVAHNDEPEFHEVIDENHDIQNKDIEPEPIQTIQKPRIFKNKYVLAAGILVFLGVNIGIASYLLKETEQRCSDGIKNLAIMTDKELTKIEANVHQTQQTIAQVAQRQHEGEQVMVAMANAIEANNNQIGQIAQGVQDLESQVLNGNQEVDRILQAVTDRLSQVDMRMYQVAQQTVINDQQITEIRYEYTAALDTMLEIEQRVGTVEERQARERARLTKIARKVDEHRIEQDVLKEEVGALSETQDKQNKAIHDVTKKVAEIPKKNAIIEAADTVVAVAGAVKAVAGAVKECASAAIQVRELVAPTPKIININF